MHENTTVATLLRLQHCGAAIMTQGYINFLLFSADLINETISFKYELYGFSNSNNKLHYTVFSSTCREFETIRCTANTIFVIKEK